MVKYSIMKYADGGNTLIVRYNPLLSNFDAFDHLMATSFRQNEYTYGWSSLGSHEASKLITVIPMCGIEEFLDSSPKWKHNDGGILDLHLQSSMLSFLAGEI